MATGEHGLVIDNLLSVQMVLANGLIVEASEAKNEDLFWAIRGAGAKFGIVTSLTYKAFEQKKDVWGGLLVFPHRKLASVIDFCQNYFKVSWPLLYPSSIFEKMESQGPTTFLNSLFRSMAINLQH